MPFDPPGRGPPGCRRVDRVPVRGEARDGQGHVARVGVGECAVQAGLVRRRRRIVGRRFGPEDVVEQPHRLATADLRFRAERRGGAARHEPGLRGGVDVRLVAAGLVVGEVVVLGRGRGHGADEDRRHRPTRH